MPLTSRKATRMKDALTEGVNVTAMEGVTAMRRALEAGKDEGKGERGR